MLYYQVELHFVVLLMCFVFSTANLSSGPDWTTDFTFPNPQRSESPFTATPLSLSSKYRFTGSKCQYLTFQSWYTSSRVIIEGEQTLSFEFRTKNLNALLLYMDDSGNTDYVTLLLDNGAARLRFKFGKPQSITLLVGEYLNDNNWHRVLLTRHRYALTLSIDGNTASKSVDGEGRAYFVPQSFTYFGGLPKRHRHRLTLPAASDKAKFIGEMRRITLNRNVFSHIEKNCVREEAPPIERPCSKVR